MINVYYLQHRRNFLPILFYFMNRIKPENKKLIRLFLLNTHSFDLNSYECPQDMDIHVVKFSEYENNNYNSKFMFALKQDCEYFFKLDEDIIFSEHVWNYMIENREIVKCKDVITLSPTINIGVPTTDIFIKEFCTPEDIEYIQEQFLTVDIQKTAGDRWHMDLEHLNDFTRRAKRWEPDKFYDRLSKLDSDIRGIHPVRFDLFIQEYLMNVVCTNITKFISKGKFEPVTLRCPYLVNDLCLYETEKIRKIEKEMGFDPYDEIPMNKYAFEHNWRHVYIKGAFALHTFYAFVSRFDPSKHDRMYHREHSIHNLILTKAKEIHHFDL